ncbi:MAG: S26 family signal peptidase [Butyricicoccus sp.]
MQQTENKKSEGRFSSELFGWGESLMAVLVFFVVVFTFFVRLIGVDGMSMYPTLEDHSIMLVSNLNIRPSGRRCCAAQGGFLQQPADRQAHHGDRR